MAFVEVLQGGVAASAGSARAARRRAALGQRAGSARAVCGQRSGSAGSSAGSARAALWQQRAGIAPARGQTKVEHIDHRRMSSFDSAERLLADAGNAQLRKAFVLDSVRIHRFHKSYKAWEAQQRAEYVDTQIAAYNQKVGQVARVGFETDQLRTQYLELARQITLPHFRLAVELVAQFDHGRLMPNVPAGCTDVALDQIFTLEANGNLAQPNLETMQKLLDIEFRLRVERRMKYEFLQEVKQQLAARNTKWAARDAALAEFMQRLTEVAGEVERIREGEGGGLAGPDRRAQALEEPAGLEATGLEPGLEPATLESELEGGQATLEPELEAAPTTAATDDMHID